VDAATTVNTPNKILNLTPIGLIPQTLPIMLAHFTQ